MENPAERRARKMGGKVSAAVSRRKPRNTSAAAEDDDAAMVNAIEGESRLAKN